MLATHSPCYWTAGLLAHDTDRCKQALLWCLENLETKSWTWLPSSQNINEVGLDPAIEEFYFSNESDFMQFSMIWK